MAASTAAGSIPGQRTVEDVEKRRGTTWKALKAARKEATEKGLIVGSLRNHCSLLFPSHAQVASVIAKCFRLHSLSAFLSAFDCCRPPPLKKQKRKRKREKGTMSALLPQATVLPNDDEKVCKTPVEWLDFSL